MFLLDTDIVSHLFDSRRINDILSERVRRIPLDELAISIITVEEILRGRLDVVRQAQTGRRNLVEPYERFQQLYTKLHRFPILPYSVEADRAFESLPASLRRAGANDCRIAAIGLASGSTVVTANMRHFEKVPGLTVEDWTRE